MSTVDRKFIPLNFTYNANMTTFEIFAFDKRKMPQNIDLWEIKDIHFGNQTNDVNHCDIESASYHLMKEHKFNLNAQHDPFSSQIRSVQHQMDLRQR